MPWYTLPFVSGVKETKRMFVSREPYGRTGASFTQRNAQHVTSRVSSFSYSFSHFLRSRHCSSVSVEGDCRCIRIPYSQTSKHVSELQRIRAIRLLLAADLKTHEWARVVRHESEWQRPSQIHSLLQESKVRCTSLECEGSRRPERSNRTHDGLAVEQRHPCSFGRA